MDRYVTIQSLEFFFENFVHKDHLNEFPNLQVTVNHSNSCFLAVYTKEALSGRHFECCLK